jgi:hypothetical protein
MAEFVNCLPSDSLFRACIGNILVVQHASYGCGYATYISFSDYIIFYNLGYRELWDKYKHDKLNTYALGSWRFQQSKYCQGEIRKG